MDNNKKNLNFIVRQLHEQSGKKYTNFSLPMLQSFEERPVLYYRKEWSSRFESEVDSNNQIMTQLCQTTTKHSEYIEWYFTLFRRMLFTPWKCNRDNALLILLLENWTTFISSHRTDSSVSGMMELIFTLVMDLLEKVEVIEYKGTVKDILEQKLYMKVLCVYMLQTSINVLDPLNKAKSLYTFFDGLNSQVDETC